jgi:hypothetical protein
MYKFNYLIKANKNYVILSVLWWRPGDGIQPDLKVL